MNKFPFFRQHDQMDCGPTCLRMVAKHHGRHYSMDTLRQKSGINREGVSLLGISEAAEEIGFLTVGIKYAGITKTSTTILNGYELPAAYRMKDLTALIPGLTVEFANHNRLNRKKVHSGNAKKAEK